MNVREAVECSGQSQIFDILTVTCRKIHTLHKVEDIFKRSVFLPFGQDALYGRFSHSLNSSQSETDISMTVYREFQATFVYIRTQYVHPGSLTFVHQFGNFGNVRNVTAHGSRHIFRRIVGFQISSLIGNPRIAGSMRLIEGVGSKFFPVCPDLFQNLRIMTVFLTSLDKLRLHMIQLVAQLLTHRLTQGIRFTTGKVGKQTRQQHHLLLIDSNTVCIFQILLHDGNIVLDRLTSLLTVDKVGDIIHRSRTVKGIHGNQILERSRLKFTKIFLHTSRFELERTDGSTLTIKAVSSRVVDRYLVYIQDNSFTLLNIFESFLDDGECLQSQEVHLD